jgi:hypothetical protein
MSDQRLPLAFAASPDLSTIDPQRTALVLASTGPVRVTYPPLPEGRGNGDTPGAFAVVRHAGSAAAAQAGQCNCCRVPSDLVTVLRRLVIDRARGEINIAAVLVAGEPADLARFEQDALADPFVAARYAIHAPR